MLSSFVLEVVWCNSNRELVSSELFSVSTNRFVVLLASECCSAALRVNPNPKIVLLVHGTLRRFDDAQGIHQQFLSL